jgi:hypothetical protein
MDTLIVVLLCGLVLFLLYNIYRSRCEKKTISKVVRKRNEDNVKQHLDKKRLGNFYYNNYENFEEHEQFEEEQERFEEEQERFEEEQERFEEEQERFEEQEPFEEENFEGQGQEQFEEEQEKFEETQENFDDTVNINGYDRLNNAIGARF